MKLRQSYRWLKALKGDKMVEKFDRSPARYRLKPIGTRLGRSVNVKSIVGSQLLCSTLQSGFKVCQ